MCDSVCLIAEGLMWLIGAYGRGFHQGKIGEYVNPLIKKKWAQANMDPEREQKSPKLAEMKPLVACPNTEHGSKVMHFPSYV